MSDFKGCLLHGITISNFSNAGQSEPFWTSIIICNPMRRNKMWITKQTENAEQIKLMDATSKVIIWVINHANSPEISRLGNLTHIPFFQGFSNSDGTILVNTSTSGITVSRQKKTLSCNYPVMQSASPMLPVPSLYNITSWEFQSILQEMLWHRSSVSIKLIWIPFQAN